MISRAEFLYTKVKIEKTRHILDTFKLGVYDRQDPRWPAYHMYEELKKFKALPWSEQQRIRGLWNAYYRACAESPAAKRLKEAREADARRDIAKVKDLANEAKLDLELKLTKEIPRPGEFDPDELYQKMRWVTDLEHDLEVLTKTYNEYKDVYEKRDKQLSEAVIGERDPFS